MERNITEPAAKQRRPFFASFVNRIGGVFLAPDDTFNKIVVDKAGFWESFLLVVMLVAVEGVSCPLFPTESSPPLLGS
jgi:hypothetical protein